jgi:hypothetical protein
VLEVDDLEDRALDVDVIAGLELVGGDDGRSAFLEPNLDGVSRDRRGPV